jgi:hydroxypyruvate reductase
MTDDAKPTVLLGPGLGVMRGMFEPDYAVLDFPRGDMAAFAACSEAQGIRAFVSTGSRAVEPEIAGLPQLGLVAVIGVGYEGIDVKGLRAKGVDVSYAPNSNSDDVADHAVGLLIAEVRKITAGERRLLAGEWVKGRYSPATRSIKTLKIGIVGLGAIGLAIAKRLEAFGCAISWWGPHPKPDAAYPRAESVLKLADDSDVLILAHRADDANRGLVSAEVIAALGARGVLVNISRGSAVDEDALISALKDGRLGGAALDVFEEEPTPPGRWKDVPNVTLTPHTAGAGEAGLAAMTGLVAQNVRLFLSGRPLATPVPPQV